MMEGIPPSTPPGSNLDALAEAAKYLDKPSTPVQEAVLDADLTLLQCSNMVTVN